MDERKPSIYIPTLYLAEGLPYALVNMMSAVFFKTLGASNEFIGLTSLLYIPWTIKGLWSPLIDIYGTKRSWIVSAELALAILIALVALGCLSPCIVVAALAGFTLIAFASATQDAAIDGFYLDALGTEDQAFYVGIRNAFYKLAWLIGSGALVWLAGRVGELVGIATGWSLAFAVCAGFFVVVAAFHGWYLPQPARHAHASAGTGLTPALFLKVFSSYFQQPGIAVIVIYILIFRLGDALMLKMAQPFLLDEATRGGLAISTEHVGIIYGTAGTIALLSGGILGSWLIARGGLRRWLWPTALIQNSAILLYWLLALYEPALIWVAAVNALEQFSYGLGVAAYTVLLLGTVRAEFKSAHYAITTGLMALGMMLPGAASGFLCARLGYPSFFLVSFLAAIPGMITIFFLHRHLGGQERTSV